MALQIDWKLFLSTLALIFVAELPDKTAFATLLLATRKHPLAIFIGVAMAFVIQSVIAVSFGSALGLLPRQWVSIGGAVLFMLFAFLMWRRKDHEEENLHLENQKSNFLRTIWSSFVVIFIAEWGDLTQLASATLAAEHKKPVTVFLAATLALWTVTALAILVGNRAKKVIHPVLLQKIAAGAFALVGVILLFRARGFSSCRRFDSSLATSAPQQIPWLNIPPRKTKVFSLVKLRLQICEALGISVSDGTESPFGGIAQEPGHGIFSLLVPGPNLELSNQTPQHQNRSIQRCYNRVFLLVR